MRVVGVWKGRLESDEDEQYAQASGRWDGSYLHAVAGPFDRRRKACDEATPRVCASTLIQRLLECCLALYSWLNAICIGRALSSDSLEMHQCMAKKVK